MLNNRLAIRLAEIKRQGLYRSRRIATATGGAAEVFSDGRRLINFSSNDYLGLAQHPEVVAAMVRGAQRWGAGSGASHLVSGHGGAHQALEEALADYTGRERALLFSTGYMANLGVVGALAERGGAVFEDRLNHASLLDAALLSGAGLRRYAHRDIGHLADLMSAGVKPGSMVVSDGVFSMDGDAAPVVELAAMARSAQAWFMVDDAHGLGVMGDSGRGVLELAGLDQSAVPVLVGTLGKAFGVFGAFVAGSEALIEYLIQRARSYIYTTALPPAVAEAALQSLQIAQTEAWRREKLKELIAYFREEGLRMGLNLLPSTTPVQPVLIGDNTRAMAISLALNDAGFLVSAIRPPTVPAGTARLRITLSAVHEREQVGRLLEILGHIAGQPG
ncbi:8-amino-7-oxononanoate synthase [Candidatus Methylospira mobilis]|uniref:8-amino-7-oxononanoate synthase n=1 Tax=Candidatus Methylospira mobilis TaxID=1808979 RepID=A0A5Q0BSE3_9GAMM|nr:8-amino-7-oxononanoate synthase [Candidatus Methylospira mobilis]